MAIDLQSMTARVRAWAPAEWAAGMACALAGAGLLVWAVRLWSEWEKNPDLSHGFLALPAVVLLWQRAREHAAGGRGLGAGWQTGLAAVGGAGLCVASLFATVYAVAMDWSAVPTLFLLSAVAATAMALAAVLAAGRAVRWIRPGWTVLVMLAVVLLSAPLPPATYARLTMGLQEMITVGVVETLRLFGVPALRMGNVINLGTTSVGVEEACSGVRSLVSCVLAGLVLSALLLRSPWRRAVLVGLAAPLALLTNFARSLTLTLLARNGVDIAGAWHDGLGYAVLGATTCLLGALAFGLEEKTPVATGAPPVSDDGVRLRGWRLASSTVLACLALAAGWF
ncbi:MAG: exosortase/archaeosortase family protein, partial [Burkholderiales bacterium]|nr:exosortase/archaeosortase family protein [Opitutaceae bacterium]